MSKIYICVSHRIDINSELIDNPLYFPVRCGAVFDDKNPMHIAGDDTGDHISQKRMSFCEFTVQYWAWKNVKADYYGLCHYRRYLSFSPHRFKTDEYNMIYAPELTPKSKKKYGLLDTYTMERLISEYDIVVSESANVIKIPTPRGKMNTVMELWNAQDGVFFEKYIVGLMMDLIDQTAPLYSRSAREYFAGNRHRGFNCYVMRKELFERLCEFQFPVMFEVERQLNTTGYSQTMLRTPAFVGEMLYGIFLYHVTTYEQWKLKELQMVFFQNTEHIRGLADLLRRYIWGEIDCGLRAAIAPILPKGSFRREIVKHYFYVLTPAKRRGVASIRQGEKRCEGK